MPYLSATSWVLSSSRPTTEIDLHVGDLLDRVEVLDAERAGTGEGDLTAWIVMRQFSRIRWPTAVFDAGTW